MPQVSVVAPQKQKVEKTVRIVDVSKPQVGTRLQHYWRHKRGDGGDWYESTVRSITKGDDGVEYYNCEYDKCGRARLRRMTWRMRWRAGACHGAA
jgi:hypothetical protein